MKRAKQGDIHLLTSELATQRERPTAPDPCGLFTESLYHKRNEGKGRGGERSEGLRNEKRRNKKR